MSTTALLFAAALLFAIIPLFSVSTTCADNSLISFPFTLISKLIAGKHCRNTLNHAKGGVAKVVNVMNTPLFSSSVPPGEKTSFLTSTP